MKNSLSRKIRRFRRGFFLLVTLPAAIAAVTLAVMDEYQKAVNR